MSKPVWVANAYGWDRALAAMFGGAKRGETLSQAAGMAAAAGERWGCVLCRVLHRVVERDHCRLSLEGEGATAHGPALRAGALLLLVGAALSFACWAAWAALFWAARAVGGF